MVLAFGVGGPADIAIIAVAVLILFGGSKIRDFARMSGEGIKEFKKATRDDEPAASATPPAASAPPASGSSTEPGA